MLLLSACFEHVNLLFLSFNASSCQSLFHLHVMFAIFDNLSKCQIVLYFWIRILLLLASQSICGGGWFECETKCKVRVVRQVTKCSQKTPSNVGTWSSARPALAPARHRDWGQKLCCWLSAGLWECEPFAKVCLICVNWTLIPRISSPPLSWSLPLHIEITAFSV